MALARALAVEPRVMLLDEPFGALDAQVRRELREWLRRLHTEVHVTTVLVTHDQEEAMEVADTIAVLNRGRIEQVGAPRDLYDRPANPFVMTFIGAANRIGDLFIRPHEVTLLPHAGETAPRARIERLVYLGFEVRAEMVLAEGQPIQALLTREEAERLELQQGQTVGLDLRRGRRFSPTNPYPSAREMAGATSRL